MRGLRGSKLAAACLYVLTASVVLGGMAWATVATYRLARDEHLNKIRVAIWRMEGQLGSVLAAEWARPTTDYVAAHARQDVPVVTEDGRELDGVLAILPSPIRESGPPQPWIELYFQVDESGRFSSPQLSGEAAGWSLEPGYPSPSDDQAARTLRWLESQLSIDELHRRVAAAIERDRLFGATREPGEKLQAIHLAQRVTEQPEQAGESEFQFRARTKITAQLSSLPLEECVPADLAELNLASTTAEDQALVDPLGPLTSIEKSHWVTFWLESLACGCQKLCFVRTVVRDDQTRGGGRPTRRVSYQGFVADWNSLRPTLASRISDLYPDADLVPVRDDQPPDAAMSEMEMSTVPVRLDVPEMAGGTSVAAWRSVRWVLLTSWLAAGGVLGIAGWGIRNLVALTERRMQFAYAVTHELRTPLTTFRLYSDMLSAGLVPDESRQEYLDTLNRESERLSSLVEGVLEYARLENRRVKLSPRPVDPAGLLATIGETLTARCHGSDIEPRTELQAANGVPLLVDVDVVNQVAGVLINNACRYTRGSSQPRVLVRLSSVADRLHLDVIDSGPGIDRADARKIFRPFRRGRRADQEARGGVGLGLALARSWAGLLGGRLELVARHDPQFGGAHFRLTIPRQIKP